MTHLLIIIRHGLMTLSIISICAVTQQSCTPSIADTNNLAAYLDTAMPAFELEDYLGATVSSEQFRGKFLVIHIATTWCPFCNAEAPNLEQLYQEYRDRGVAVLIIDVKEDRELVKEKLIDRFNLSFPVLFDLDGAIAASLAPADVLPDLARDEVMLASNLLVDAEGKIQFFSLLDTNNFDARLLKLKSVLDELL